MTEQKLPLIVDLDGTLVKTDLLLESFLGLIKLNPFYMVLVVVWLLRGKACLKSEIADRVNLDITVLPYNSNLIGYITSEREVGRQIILATASHKKYAFEIANHLRIFDDVIASDEHINLTGKTKAAVLCDRYGENEFAYAGNANPDLNVWSMSGGAILVDTSKALELKATKLTNIETKFLNNAGGFFDYVKACRLHQWVKNGLIFIPIASAHQLTETATLASGLLAFLAFSLCASSVYLLNDLLDLDSDRHHKTKRHRPFAKGTLSVLHGILLIPALLISAGLLTTFLPPIFAAVLVIYYCATTSYSFCFKKTILLDVIILSGLYTTRIIAGAAATGIPLSEWLLVFSMFIFLSLALVKRYTELVELKTDGKMSATRGRGYEVSDIELLSSLGGSSGYISVLILALYFNSDFVKQIYPNSEVLWMICPIMLYWISRVWVLAHRGQMHDDPIVFAIKDPVSRYIASIIGLIFVLAGLNYG